METEICRLLFVQDRRREDVFWWEARQPTVQRERIILKGPEYVDEYYRVSKTWSGALSLTFGRFRKQFDLLQKSQDQKRATNAFVVAQLAANGWEPASADEQGLVTLMKRIKP